MASLTPIGVMITRFFPGRAGLANAVAISGMALGQLVIIAALAVVLAPMMSKRLSPDSLGTATREPLKALTLTAYPHALWSGGKGAFRDRFLASQVGLGRNRQVA